MSGFLASVSNVGEARAALGAHADIIDCKNPHEGALGSLPPEIISGIVETADGERLTSATTGDDVRTARRLIEAIHTTADCGVDYIKFGLFDAEAAPRLIGALDSVAADHDLIAVCFADRYNPTALIGPLANCGVHGIMLDTADKASGPLTRLWDVQRLADFVNAVRQQGLVCGLAGRLAIDDIPALLPLQADYLGFRSALCQGDRRGVIDHAALMRVREAIPYRTDAAAIRRTGKLH